MSQGIAGGSGYFIYDEQGVSGVQVEVWETNRQSCSLSNTEASIGSFR
jgi:hypothetical protein